MKDAGNYTTPSPFHSSLSLFLCLSFYSLSVCLSACLCQSVVYPFSVSLYSSMCVAICSFSPSPAPFLSFSRVSLVYVGACVYVYFEYTRVQYLDLHWLYRPSVTAQTANPLVAQFGIGTGSSGSKHYSSCQTIPHSMSLPMLGRRPVRPPDIVAYTAQVC